MERCDHRDAHGSTIWTDRMCLLCNRTIPPTLSEAIRHSIRYLMWSIRSALKR